MKDALARQDSILREAIESNGGYVIKTTGDGVHSVFDKAIEAVHATVTAPPLPMSWNALLISFRRGIWLSVQR